MCLCLLHNSSLDELEELAKSYCLGLPNKVSERISCEESKKKKLQVCDGMILPKDMDFFFKLKF
jgi:hypothetical protein